LFSAERKSGTVIKKIMLVFVLLATAVFGRDRYSGGTSVTASSIKDAISASSNGLIVYPDDDLQAAYNWLKSSDRDDQMGPLSYTNRRIIALMPGDHNVVSTLAVDTSFIDFIAPWDNVVITADTGVTVIERTALNVIMKGITIQVIPKTSAGKPYACGLKENASNTANHVTLVQSGNNCTLNATGIGVDVIPKATSSGLSKYPIGDDILIWDTNGNKRRWYSIIAVTDDDNITIENCTATDFNDPNVAVVSMTSRFEDMEFLLVGDAGGAGANGKGRPVWGATHLGGTWINCRASSMAWRTDEDMDCHMITYNLFAGNQSIGGDNEGKALAAGLGKISGRYYNSYVTDMGFGGCTVFGMICTDQAEFYNCYTYSRGFAMGLPFYGKAINCGGNNKLFGVPVSSLYPGGFYGYAEGCYVETDGAGASSSFGMTNSSQAGVGGNFGRVINSRVGTLDEYIAGTGDGMAWNKGTGIAENCHPYKPTDCAATTAVLRFWNGQTYTNRTATGAITFSLPYALPNLNYKLVDVNDTATVDLTVNPKDTDRFILPDGIVMDLGEALIADDDTHNWLRVTCNDPNVWIVEYGHTWTQQNP